MPKKKKSSSILDILRYLQESPEPEETEEEKKARLIKEEQADKPVPVSGGR